MCAMMNWFTLIKNITLYCTYASIWKVLPTEIIENHQLVVSLNASLYQEVRYRCITELGIISLNTKFLLSLIYLNKWILLEILLEFLVLLPLLSIHTDDLIYNLIRGDFYGTAFGYLLWNSFLASWSVI